jgi:hypothetical protein
MAKQQTPVGRHWRCEQREDECVVSGFVEATELWQPIVTLSGSPSLLADVARLVELVNGRQDDAELLRSAFEALKAIEEEGYTCATEWELDDAIARLEEQQPKSA